MKVLILVLLIAASVQGNAAEKSNPYLKCVEKAEHVFADACDPTVNTDDADEASNEAVACLARVIKDCFSNLNKETK